MSIRNLRRAAIIRSGQRLLSHVDGVLSHYSRLPDAAVYPSAGFPWAARLEADWRAIRTEQDHLLAVRRSIPPVRDISPDHDMIAVDDRWRSLFLVGYGFKCEENCRLCPHTMRLLRDIPGLLTAFFSVLEPGAHIPCHTGPTKAILTAHLALRIPRDAAACRMQVGQHEVAWREGEVVVFDDMYPHEVWNLTDEPRVVLLLQLRRPQRFPGTLIREALLGAMRRSPFVQDAVRNLQVWHDEARHDR